MAKILVIEDDRGIRNLLDALLSHKGYHVLLAENGEKGLELFRQARPDVIVLDLKMPEMDGLTALRHIRSLNLNQPVIIYSGAWTPKKEEHVRAIGFTETVAKDCSWEHLEEALKRALKSLDPEKERVLPDGKVT
jgi:two-component system, NtrC family, response regulator AtoC